MLNTRGVTTAPCGWPPPPASSCAAVEDKWGNFELAVGERKFWVRGLVTVRDLILRMGLVFGYGLLEIVLGSMQSNEFVMILFLLILFYACK
jgi:hypothetical protein